MPRPTGAQQTEPVIVRPFSDGWPPRCVSRRCDFAGEPSAESSPYIYCGDPLDPSVPGDFRRHYRAELSPETVAAGRAAQSRIAELAALAEQVPAGRRRAGFVGTGECAFCGVRLAVRDIAGRGPILPNHGPRGKPCPGAWDPCATGTFVPDEPAD